MTMERNLAEFYSRLATAAFERGQWDVAAGYIRMVNALMK